MVIPFRPLKTLFKNETVQVESLNYGMFRDVWLIQKLPNATIFNFDVQNRCWEPGMLFKKLKAIFCLYKLTMK